MATVGICLVFELRKFRSAIHQGHRRLVAAVNVGHKKPSRSWWICPYISRHLSSLNPLLARCRRYSRG
ncbi:hypothetical protein ACPXAS_03165, partial [Escherichia coli]|uniref:hypothetical protein n=2 Tax=Escherichia coli TaxID=562 RepID=UPI003CE55BEF